MGKRTDSDTEGDESTKLRNKSTKLEREVRELRRAGEQANRTREQKLRELRRRGEVANRERTLRDRELDRAARFHLGVEFEDPDPELGSWAPDCTTNLIARAIHEGYVDALREDPSVDTVGIDPASWFEPDDDEDR